MVIQKYKYTIIMKNELLKTVKGAVKNWWISLLIGILAIILGIWCITTPWATIITLSIVFATIFIVSGIGEIAYAISNKDNLNGWGWSLASGIIDLLFGIIVASLPPLSIAIVMSYFVGFWVMYRSITAIAQSVELQKLGINGWGWLLAFAILGVLASFIFIISPAFTTAFIVAFVSIGFFFYGIFRIMLAFKLKSIKKNIKDIEE